MSDHPGRSHSCPVQALRNGVVDNSWCFDHMSKVLANLPPIESQPDALRPELQLGAEGRLMMYYCPFDYINLQAKIVIVGITPGLQQLFLSCREAQIALNEGFKDTEVLRRARNAGAFGGPMRTNLTSMLDGIGLHKYLGIETTGQLFSEHSDLLHGTSMVLYPTFVDGKNYRGSSPKPETNPLTRTFIEHVLPAELAAVHNAVIVPLGNSVSRVLQRGAHQGAIQPERCLVGFPHPSGGNGHRVAQYRQQRDAMAAQVAAWS